MCLQKYKLKILKKKYQEKWENVYIFDNWKYNSFWGPKWTPDPQLTDWCLQTEQKN